ncbi:MAG: fibronectin type III domain-containing protein [Patescibacteria group bacterium]
MKNIKMFQSNIVRSIFGAGMVLSFVFGIMLPLSASAAPLYRQLQLGMRGGDVSDLQVFLATNPSIYPSGLVTGYFGSLTQSAVQRFQAANGIVSSGTPSTTGYGRVGPTTMATINAQMGGGVTTGVDRMSPIIGAVTVSAGNSSSVINWNTSENASAIIYYSTSPLFMMEGSATTGVTISGASNLVHSDLKASHSANLTGLQANTTYHYVVYVRDVNGNESITWPSTFRTTN